MESFEGNPLKVIFSGINYFLIKQHNLKSELTRKNNRHNYLQVLSYGKHLRFAYLFVFPKYVVGTQEGT